VHLDQVAHDCEPKPQPAMHSGEGAVVLSEAIEHIGQKFFADSFPTPQKLWTIADLGGWNAVDPALFDKDNGSITKIYKQATG